MKKLFFIAALAAMICSCGPKNGYTINGQIEGFEGDVAIMTMTGEKIAESTAGKTGKFELTGVAEQPSFALLALNDIPSTMFFLEKGKITINGKFENVREAEIKGTLLNNRILDMRAEQKALNEKHNEGKEAIYAEDEAISKKYISENSDNILGLFLLQQATASYEAEEIDAALAQFTPEMQENKMTGEIRRIAEIKRQNGYTIIGKIEGFEGDVAIMTMTGEKIAESTTGKYGKFELTGVAEQPSFALLALNDIPSTMFFLEKGKITINGKFENVREAEIKGTLLNNRILDMRAEQKALNEKYQAATTNEEKEAIYAEDEAISKKYIAKNTDNILGLFLLQQAATNYEAEEIDAALAQFTPEMQEIEAVGEIRRIAEIKRPSSVGNTYMDIALTDINGKKIALSSFVKKGKYVLLDFWASWCGPCMGEVPYLVETYGKYKGKGFEIFAVSHDRNEVQWKDAIKANNMTWQHVNGVKDQKSAMDYAVFNIPSNFLISPEGIIVAKNLRGEELEATLAKYLK